MFRQKLALIGGGAAILGGVWISVIQVDLEFPWLLMIAILLLAWAVGLAGLLVRAPAGQVGKMGITVSLFAIACMFIGVMAGDTIWMIEWFFPVIASLIPAGLVVYGIAAIRTKALGKASWLPAALGVITFAWINLLNPAWPRWIEQSMIFAIGLSWLLLGLTILRRQPPEQDSQLESPTLRQAQTPLNQAILLGLILVPYLILQGWIWQKLGNAIICPTGDENQSQPFTGKPRPVIIDADMAHEDMIAILFLLQHPAAEVQAITVSGTGEAHCEPGVRHAQSLAALHGDPSIPVACGPEAPLVGDHEFPTEWRAAADNLYGVVFQTDPVPGTEKSAPELIVDIVRESPQKVTLVAVGPLTNLALAFQADPDITAKIEMIYIMGGAVELGGNVGMSGVGINNPVAEWNIYIDPFAANIVFDSGAPITLVPLNATRYVPITTDFYRCIQDNHPTPEAFIVYKILEANYDFIESGGFQFWDSLTAAISVDNGLAEYEDRELVVIETEGGSIGQTLPVTGGTPVRLATSASAPPFENLLLNTLTGLIQAPRPTD